MPKIRGAERGKRDAKDHGRYSHKAIKHARQQLVCFVPVKSRVHIFGLYGASSVNSLGKVITIFSAPNYCDQMGNKGALIKLKGKTLKPNFIKFTAVVYKLN